MHAPLVTTTSRRPTAAPLGVAAVAALVVALTTGCSTPPTGPDAGAVHHAAARADDGDRTPTWVWPTGSNAVVRGWEQPADEYAAGHRGIDVAAAPGATVVAVADGTVSFAGQVAGRGVVSIDHGGGLVSTLDSVDPRVAEGEVVAQGDQVGAVAVGHCSDAAPCLHLGARLDGRYVDPMPFLPTAAWPVLLPESAWPG